jgi:hypothetical protein
MSKCTFCKTNNEVRVAVVEAGKERELVDACGGCIEEYGLTTELLVPDLPYPRGGGDIYPKIIESAVNDDLLLISFAVNNFGARVGKYYPSN